MGHLHLQRTASQPDRLRTWSLRLERSGGHNKAAVALANKLARIAWAGSTSERDFEIYPLPEAA